MKQREKEILDVMETLGFEVRGVPFVRTVELLLGEHIRLMQEIEIDNKEFFKRELERVVKQPTN
jgi:transcriptional regulatory protein LevR